MSPKIWVSWFAVACIALATILTLIASLLTPDANMVASTISDVAAGPYDWVQDTGLYLLSAGLCALAYGMNESGEIHIYLVYAYGFSFLALLLLSIPHLMTHNSWWRPLNLWWFGLWTAGAFYYFMMNTEYDGLVERGLGFAYLAWIFLLSWRLAIEGGSPWGKQAASSE